MYKELISNLEATVASLTQEKDKMWNEMHGKIVEYEQYESVLEQLKTDVRNKSASLSEKEQEILLLKKEQEETNAVLQQLRFELQAEKQT